LFLAISINLKIQHKSFFIVFSLLTGLMFHSCEQAIEQKTDASRREVETPHDSLNYRVVASELVLPWEVAWGPDNWLWLTESSMNLRRIHPETREWSKVSIGIDGLTGEHLYDHFMHGLAFHPGFEKNKKLYISYILIPITNDSTAYLSVVSLKYDSAKQALTEPKYIIKDFSVENSYLPGGKLLVHDDHLFVCGSDEREDGLAQDTSSIGGKILRFNLDGTIPIDNPISGSPIWTIGHRNPQGLTITTDEELIGYEHGPIWDDEVNKIEKGKNYGWPIVSGYCDKPEEDSICQIINIKEPLIAWTPTIAPGSILFYGHNRYQEWSGKFLASTLKETDLRLLSYSGNQMTEEKIYLDQKFGRLRDLCMSPDGRVFLITFNQIPAKHPVNYRPVLDTSFSYEVLVEIWPKNEYPKIPLKGK
jgi:glucose/arabinose dehydrogenase